MFCSKVCAVLYEFDDSYIMQYVSFSRYPEPVTRLDFLKAFVIHIIISLCCFVLLLNVKMKQNKNKFW